jgi:hypothetical protein
MWKKAHILYLIIIYWQIIWFRGGLARLVRFEYLTENSFDTQCRTGYNIVYSVQARLFLLLSMKQRPDYLFYLQIYFWRCLFHQKLVSYYFKTGIISTKASFNTKSNFTVRTPPLFSWTGRESLNTQHNFFLFPSGTSLGNVSPWFLLTTCAPVSPLWLADFYALKNARNIILLGPYSQSTR